MVNDPFARNAVINSARTSDAGLYNPLAGVNVTRQYKFQARQQRRWGDFSYWGVPAPVLWLDTPCFLSPFEDVLFVAPDIVDIWE